MARDVSSTLHCWLSVCIVFTGGFLRSPFWVVVVWRDPFTHAVNDSCKGGGFAGGVLAGDGDDMTTFKIDELVVAVPSNAPATSVRGGCGAASATSRHGVRAAAAARKHLPAEAAPRFVAISSAGDNW